MQYQLNTAHLRVQRGPGNADLDLEYPFRMVDGEKVYDRSEPLLVEFDELCQVNIPQMLRIGIITEVAEPPPPAASEYDEETDDG